MTDLVKSAFSLSSKLLRAQWVPISILFIVGALISISVEDASGPLQAANDPMVWVVRLSGATWEIFEAALVFLILSWAIPKVYDMREPGLLRAPFEREYMSTFVAESLRVLAKMLLWAILLILPGFYKYLRYIFVSYIALFSQKYENDEVDALKYSHDLTRNQFGTIIGFFLATSALQIVLELLPMYNETLHSLPVRLPMMAASLFVGVWSYSLMFLLFTRALKEK